MERWEKNTNEQDSKGATEDADGQTTSTVVKSEPPSTPPGLGVPPGLGKSVATSEATPLPPGLGPPGLASASQPSKVDDTDNLAAGVQNLEVGGETADAPDPSLKSTGLKDVVTEMEKKTANGMIYSSAKSFEDLGLREDLLQGLYTEMRFSKPSRVQGETLPMILTPPHLSIVAQAQNGCGKTTCFVLAMLTRVDPDRTEPQALCVCPTRELVIQNLAVVRKMGKLTNIKSCSTATAEDDGVSTHDKIRQQIVVGTHGRMKMWLSRRTLALDNVMVLVLDEADNMLASDGFAGESFRMIRDIRRKSPKVQLLLFSATFNDQVRRFTEKIFENEEYNSVFLKKEELSLDVIKQYRVVVPNADAKYRVLADRIFPICEKLGQTIIFVRSREGTRRLHAQLTRDGHTCTAISGDMEHDDRDRVVQEFRDNVTRILISTDVLSRGFNVDDVTLVVNYDIPTEQHGGSPAFETYLHRIGRSGRFGRKGAAFNLISTDKDARLVDEIARYFDHEIPEVAYDDEDAFTEVLKKAGLTEG